MIVRFDKRAPRGRRGSLLVEVAMATVLLMIAMALTVKVLTLLGHERRSVERRQQALAEVANLMERVTAYPFEQVTPELARRITLSSAALAALPDPELALEVSDCPPEQGRTARRIAIRLRWRGRSGTWEAPVRLTSWIERRKGRT
jgi:hypothetical protein